MAHLKSPVPTLPPGTTFFTSTLQQAQMRVDPLRLSRLRWNSGDFHLLEWLGQGKATDHDNRNCLPPLPAPHL